MSFSPKNRKHKIKNTSFKSRIYRKKMVGGATATDITSTLFKLAIKNNTDGFMGTYNSFISQAQPTSSSSSTTDIYGDAIRACLLNEYDETKNTVIIQLDPYTSTSLSLLDYAAIYGNYKLALFIINEILQLPGINTFKENQCDMIGGGGGGGGGMTLDQGARDGFGGGSEPSILSNYINKDRNGQTIFQRLFTRKKMMCDTTVYNSPVINDLQQFEMLLNFICFISHSQAGCISNMNDVDATNSNVYKIPVDIDAKLEQETIKYIKEHSAEYSAILPQVNSFKISNNPFVRLTYFNPAQDNATNVTLDLTDGISTKELFVRFKDNTSQTFVFSPTVAPIASTPLVTASTPLVTASIPPVTASIPPVTASTPPVTASIPPVTSSLPITPIISNATDQAAASNPAPTPAPAIRNELATSVVPNQETMLYPDESISNKPIFGLTEVNPNL